MTAPLINRTADNGVAVFELCNPPANGYSYAADEFWPKVMEPAHSFCPPGRAAQAVGLIKRSVQTGLEVPLESGLALERELQQRLFAAEDAREGLAAFVEKREAEFKGR